MNLFSLILYIGDEQIKVEDAAKVDAEVCSCIYLHGKCLHIDI